MPKLRDVLERWQEFELDDSIYVPAGEVRLDGEASIVPIDKATSRSLGGMVYLLGSEQVRDVVKGLGSQFGRSPTGEERLKAVLHYARHDAFIDPRDL
jgi:hypothetical protein